METERVEPGTVQSRINFRDIALPTYPHIQVTRSTQYIDFAGNKFRLTTFSQLLDSLGTTLHPYCSELESIWSEILPRQLSKIRKFRLPVFEIIGRNRDITFCFRGFCPWIKEETEYQKSGLALVSSGKRVGLYVTSPRVLAKTSRGFPLFNSDLKRHPVKPVVFPPALVFLARKLEVGHEVSDRIVEYLANGDDVL